ncbi:MAG: prepilin-type N-terminal cleavage/methylation domain-containing protein, partial [Chitinivibrionales bacterium]|nr:prepilin-type N-terminal cleavage/methylation domain-containing protein [Chitinivibrionales bacterium]MBD3358722.1 prepilin-type N-terminal cleavage/methylation domain-containing protein [Chitinivibrionales bacterium]
MIKQGQRGFSLLEMIAVLAIISILASAITPSLSRRISRALADAEDKSLRSIAQSIRRVAAQTHIVPGTAVGEWDIAAAQFLEIPTATIVGNKGAGTRRLISRPTNGLGGTPYDQADRFENGPLPQGTLPSAPPLEARMVLVSSLDGDPPGISLSNAQFDAVWEQEGAVPNGFAETEKLRIERINFASLFHPVTVNCLSVAGIPRWRLDVASAKSLTTGTFTVYLLVGTRIGLY